MTLALFGSGEIALIAFPSIGFFASVMWSVHKLQNIELIERESDKPSEL